MAKNKFLKKNILLIIILIATLLTVWFLVLAEKHPRYLKVAFLDVGQGDAIYIEAPNRKQVLIDGGRDYKLIQSLAKVMPLADRSLDLLIITHRDSDHIGGLPMLLDRYRLGGVIDNGQTSQTEISQAIDQKIDNLAIPKMMAHKNMRIVLYPSRNIYLEILYPDRDISQLDPNEGSVVVKLVDGQNSFLFTGDAGLYVESLIMWENRSEDLDIDVLKLGHHGARTSSSLLWLEKTSPQLAIVSAGRNNSYGHPHQEVLDRLAELKIPYLSTANQKTILIKSDGFRLVY